MRCCGLRKLILWARTRPDSATYKHILKKNGVKVISATENISDSPEGILLESLLEGLSEYYPAELSVKIQRGQMENAMKGKNNGGTVLKNRKYIGEYRYGKIVIPDKLPVIIDVELFDRVQRRMEVNRHAPARAKADEEYLLTTKLFCGHCGRMLAGESDRSRNGAEAGLHAEGRRETLDRAHRGHSDYHACAAGRRDRPYC